MDLLKSYFTPYTTNYSLKLSFDEIPDNYFNMDCSTSIHYPSHKFVCSPNFSRSYSDSNNLTINLNKNVNFSYF